MPLFHFPRVETAGQRRILAQISPANAGGDHGPCALNRGSQTVLRPALLVQFKGDASAFEDGYRAKG